jgi:hypothetical protein
MPRPSAESVHRSALDSLLQVIIAISFFESFHGRFSQLQCNAPEDAYLLGSISVHLGSNNAVPRYISNTLFTLSFLQPIRSVCMANACSR